MGNDDIKELINRGNYEHALSILNQESYRDNINAKIFKIQLYYHRGEFREGIRLALSVIDYCQNNNLLQEEFEAHVYLVLMLHLSENKQNLAQKFGRVISLYNYLITNSVEIDPYWLCEFYVRVLVHAEKYLQFVNIDPIDNGQKDYHKEALRIAQKIQYSAIIPVIYSFMGERESRSGYHRLADEYFQKALNTTKKPFENQFLLGVVYSMMIFDHLVRRGETDIARIYIAKVYEIASRLENNRLLRGYYHLKGILALVEQNYEEALQYFLRHQEISEKYGYNVNWHNMHIAYVSLGDYDKALRCQYNEMAISKTISSELEFHSPLRYSGMGRLHLFKGELNTAQRLFEDGLKLARERGNFREIGALLHSLAEVHYGKDDLEKAVEYYTEGLNYFTKLNHNFAITDLLVSLIEIALAQDNHDEVESYFSRISKIESENHHFIIEQNHLLSKALILKSSKQIEDKAEAKQIFTKLANDERIGGMKKIKLELHLLDMLLDEFVISKDNKKLTEIDSKIRDLYEECQSNHFYPIMIRLLIIRSKLEMVRGRINKAHQLLVQASLIAEERGLQHLSGELHGELNKLENEKEKWEQIILENLGPERLVDRSRLRKYLTQAISQTKMMDTLFKTSE